MKIKNYLYDTTNNELHVFHKQEDRNSLSRKLKNNPQLLFNLQMADDFLKTDNVYTLTMYADDNEGYSLGYITAVSVRASDSGIIVEFSEFENPPFTSQTREYRNLKDFLVEYVTELIKPKKKSK